MTLEEVIRSELASIAPAHPLVMPPDAVLPCVVYQLVSAPESQMSKKVRSRLQLMCWATSYASAVALAGQVRDLFYQRHTTVSGLHYRSQIDNTYDGQPDLDTGRYGRGVDVLFYL